MLLSSFREKAYLFGYFDAFLDERAVVHTLDPKLSTRGRIQDDFLKLAAQFPTVPSYGYPNRPLHSNHNCVGSQLCFQGAVHYLKDWRGLRGDLNLSVSCRGRLLLRKRQSFLLTGRVILPPWQLLL